MKVRISFLKNRHCLKEGKKGEAEMIRWLREWDRARIARLSTGAAAALEGQLKAAAQRAETAEKRLKVLDQDFAALFSDHQALKAQYAALQAARLQDWKLGRHRAGRNEHGAVFLRFRRQAAQ